MTTNIVLALFGAVYMIYMPIIMCLNPKRFRQMEIVVFNVVVNVLFMIYLLAITCMYFEKLEDF